ncbi:cell division protein ZapA [Geoalkalibacter sp.]|uniref:cell division protein ZapA n=1 Tax=Geoalkalibacter sp. TaxID=3041440 RepID=UPI00272DCACA|nr:cell division protein ZapA [Geoalkalibacter sp.]
MSGTGQDFGQVGAAGSGQPLKRTHQVTLLGQQYSLRSEATPEQVQDVVEFIQKAFADVAARQKAVDTLDVAVLTLLNVAGSYLHLRQNVAAGERRLTELLDKLRRIMPDGPEVSL